MGRQSFTLSLCSKVMPFGHDEVKSSAANPPKEADAEVST
jgi:hypothetical protein